MNENVFSKSYGDGNFFKAGVADLLSAPVDVIVNPANSGLSHGGGLAAISTGIFGVPKQICAEAFKRAIPIYWENNAETNVSFVFLCLMKDGFEEFYDILGR